MPEHRLEPRGSASEHPDDHRSEAPAVVRRVVLRAGGLGAATALAAPVIFTVLEHAPASDLPFFMLSGATFGVVFGLTTGIELLARSWSERSGRKAPLAVFGLASLAAALAALVLGACEVVYSVFIVTTHDAGRAYAELAEFATHKLWNPELWAIFWAFAVPFPAVMGARLRDLPLARQAGVGVIASAVAGLPVVHLLCRSIDILPASLVPLIGAALLPVLLHLADRLEERVARLLARWSAP